MTSSVRILVGVDGSPGSEAALEWAIREAALWSAATGGADRGAAPTVTALLAWTADGLPTGVLRAATQGDRDGLTRAATEMLERAIGRVGEPPAPVTLRRGVVQADPVTALTVAAADADLVVVGERGHGPIHRMTAGSVSQGVVHHAPVPVVVVRPSKDGETPRTDDRRPVVVGVDGSDLSLAALRWAAHAAAVRAVPLRVVHAWGGLDPMYSEVLVGAQGSLVRQAENVLAQAVKLGLDDASRLTVESVVSPDSAMRALLREAREAQLLVVGSRGHGGFTRLLLGSVSHQCVLHADSDVAVVRSDRLRAPADEPAAATGAAVPSA
ncbi:universal stress protein [Frankia sp. CNm7]|uniref:Universal stress protein n=1 Tax=Frankia nepalensis TaxID=1836974 RepID=A0A937R5K1_9ACTN|nr:universal stress protein [Frankia nepalensis]MBL7499459.1 universal stress protein [Frankia nepalensis]MBL7516091.1 universal stress protein [Frankia nepalensis]MBL7522890.1 universal stress protein [Frankia nepalensis]MBL7625641.1 universal stress protein [Frankia nepalensis]